MQPGTFALDGANKHEWRPAKTDVPSMGKTAGSFWLDGPRPFGLRKLEVRHLILNATHSNKMT
jgi:hypothetical protein